MPSCVEKSFITWTPFNLISANEKAFQSYGLDQSKNSPIGPKGEQLTRAALNDLIKRAYRTGDKAPIYHLHWTREPASTDLFELLEHFK